MKDLYWLAGLIEGEGCFTANRMNDKCYPKITVKMTDEDTVQRVSNMFGQNLLHYKGSADNFISTIKAKDCYQTTVTGIKARGWMMTLYPLMGKRRQSRIKELLLEDKTNKDKCNYLSAAEKRSHIIQSLDKSRGRRAYRESLIRVREAREKEALLKQSNS